MSDACGEPSRAGWIRLTPDYSGALVEFLMAEEYRCVALSERLKRWVDRGESGGRLRGMDGNRPWIHRRGMFPSAESVAQTPGFIDGAALLQQDGAGLCILPASEEGVREFVSVADAGGALSSLIGPGEDLDRVAAILASAPSEARKYLLMRFSPPSPSGVLSESGFSGAKIAARKGGIEIRRATLRDFSSLCSLHEAYEKEEIRSRQLLFAASLPERIIRILRKQIAVVAIIDGKVVGKANTNARGLGIDQLGGIYVSPEMRRRGLGSMMVENLVSLLASLGRGVCLYVRSENEEARRLYIKLGFVDAGTYASYRFH
jgi:ribosomal protein S18 acetylase RimI-like enzyme